MRRVNFYYFLSHVSEYFGNHKYVFYVTGNLRKPCRRQRGSREEGKKNKKKDIFIH